MLFGAIPYFQQRIIWVLAMFAGINRAVNLVYWCDGCWMEEKSGKN